MYLLSDLDVTKEENQAHDPPLVHCFICERSRIMQKLRARENEGVKVEKQYGSIDYSTCNHHLMDLVQMYQKSMYNILEKVPTIGAIAFKSFIEKSEGDYHIDFEKLPKGSTFWYIVDFKQLKTPVNIPMLFLAMSDFLITACMLDQMTLGELTTYAKNYTLLMTL